jgi:peptidyl-prolyl cis-trans isomerase SurA
MKNLIKIFCFLLLFFSNNFFANASANKIIAKIDNNIVTSYELKNKIRTAIFLSNQSLNQENIDKTKNQALSYLINMKIKKKEILKYKFNLNEINIDKQLISIALNDLNNFKKNFLQNNLDYEIFIEEIKIEVAWQQLIYNIYNKKINIDDKTIESILNKQVKNESSIIEFRLSEIEIEKNQDNDIDEEIKFIKEQIKKIGFENTASRYSVSPSSIKKGDLGWINEKSINTQIYKLIKDLNIGDIANPIKNFEKATFYKLSDKKISKVKNLDLEKLKKNLIMQKQNELLNFYSTSHLSKIKNNSLIEYK